MFIANGAIVSTLLVTISVVSGGPKVGRGLRRRLHSGNCRIKRHRCVLIAKRHHRGFKRKFLRVYGTVERLTTLRPRVSVMCPMRLGPGMRGPMCRLLSKMSGMCLVSPLSCLPFVCTVRRSALLLASDNKMRRRTPSLNGPILIVQGAARHPRTMRTKAMGLIKASTRTVIDGIARLLHGGRLCHHVSRARGPCNSKRTYRHVLSMLAHWDSRSSFVNYANGEGEKDLFPFRFHTIILMNDGSFSSCSFFLFRVQRSIARLFRIFFGDVINDRGAIRRINRAFFQLLFFKDRRRVTFAISAGYFFVLIRHVSDDRW